MSNIYGVQQYEMKISVGAEDSDDIFEELSAHGDWVSTKDFIEHADRQEAAYKELETYYEKGEATCTDQGFRIAAMEKELVYYKNMMNFVRETWNRMVAASDARQVYMESLTKGMMKKHEQLTEEQKSD